MRCTWSRVLARTGVCLVLGTAALLAVPSPRLYAAAEAAPAPAAPAADARRDELPVRRVVLYSSGVGYFEHAGVAPAGQAVRLMFTREQINDVLKSLVVMTPEGGSVSGVTYASQDPLERALRSFGVDISGNPTLPQLLQQLRGSAVTVHAPDPIAGTILNIEERTKVVGTPPAEITEHLMHLVTDKGLRTVALSSVQGIEFSDAKLQQELHEALTLLAQSRDRNRRAVDVTVAGDQARAVRVGYLVEAPVWKTTYRLDLSEQKPLLQSWAIVENTSEADWKNVKLSLVSGRPISFRQDLYTPLYLNRPLVVPELYASLRPKQYEEGMDGEEKQLAELKAGWETTADAAAPPASAPTGAMAAKAMRHAGGSSERLRNGQAAAEAPGGKGFGVALGGGQSMAQGAQLGELFEFNVKNEVDLPRRRSAMFPIVNQSIDAERVSIYNASTLADHPLNGAYLTNSTNMKLLPGPITVFDAGAYAGDAQIGFLAPNDRRLISYAVDLAVTVDSSESTSSQLTMGRLIRGTLEITHMYTYSRTYVIKNKDKQKRTLIVEHPLHHGRELVSPEKSKVEETTPTVYRFRVPVEGSTTGKFEVKEQQPVSQTIALLPAGIDQIAFYYNQKQIDPKVREALGKALIMKREQSLLESQKVELEKQLAAVREDQERLRRNIATVGAETTMGKRYLAKLNTQEDQIEKQEQILAGLREQIEAKKKQLADYLASL